MYFFRLVNIDLMREAPTLAVGVTPTPWHGPMRSVRYAAPGEGLLTHTLICLYTRLR